MPTLPKPIKPYWLPERKAHARRAVSNRAFYDRKAWRTLSAHMAEVEPLCRECAKAGRVTPSQCTDHIKPINEGGAMLDKANLQRLCNRCHAIKSGSEGQAKRTY